MTGYITEILGDDRVWETGLSEQSLVGWPLMYEYANLAIINNTTDRKVVINTLNTRPFTGPNHLFPCIQLGNITGYAGGTAVTPVSFDTLNAAPALEVMYRPSSVTNVANTSRMVQWVNTGMNLTRAQQWSRWQGSSPGGFDQTEMVRYTDAGTQKITLREGEGLCVCFASTDAGPNIFMLSVYAKKSTGETYLYNRMVEPLFMAGAPIMVMYNPAGSGEVYEIGRIQAREVGSDEIPQLDYFKICWADSLASDAQVVWADTSDAIQNVAVKKNCFVTRHGMNNGAIITAPRFRRILGGDFPYGPGVAGGANITRRGPYSHDMRYNDSETHLHLGPGEGMAVVLRNGSAQIYSEIIGNITVESAATGTYPAEANVRIAITYGPTGADYTGNIQLPAVGNVRNAISYGSLGTEATGNMALPGVNDVRVGVSYGTNSTEATGTIALPAVGDVKLGVSYGANGTEATGTLAAGGGGGGRHIVISGGWN